MPLEIQVKLDICRAFGWRCKRTANMKEALPLRGYTNEQALLRATELNSFYTFDCILQCVPRRRLDSFQLFHQPRDRNVALFVNRIHYQEFGNPVLPTVPRRQE